MASSSEAFRIRLRLGGAALPGMPTDPLAPVLGDPAIPAGVKAAVAHLANGGGEIAAMRAESFAADGFAGMPILDLILERLCTGASIAATEEKDDETPCLTVQPFPAALLEPASLLAGLDDATEYRLTPHLLVRPHDGKWRVESPLSAMTLTVGDATLLADLSALAAPLSGLRLRQIADVATSRLLVPALLAAGMIVRTDAEDEAPAWDFHDLLFHSRSRLGRHQNPYGGTFRGREETPAPPAIMPFPEGERIALPRPSLDRLMATDPPLSRVMEERRSERAFGATPMTAAQLGEFLFRCCRTRAVSPAGGEWQTASRPYPGGGAVYELEVYPLIRDCAGIAPGLHYYHPATHELQLVRAPYALTERMLQAAWHTLGRAGQPPVVLLVAARFDRVFWKYESMAYALILKDLGVLYATMYLAATAMGLAACALGGGDSDLFAKASGRPYEREGLVGEFVLGPRSEAAA